MKEVLEIIEGSKESYHGNIKVKFYREKNGKYRDFSPEIDKDVQQEIYHIIEGYINVLDNREITDYNPIGSSKEVIEKCKIEFVDSYNDIVDSINFSDMKKFGMDQTKFYAVSLKKGEKEVVFFRRYNKLRSLKKGFVAQIVNNTYKKVENEIVGMDNQIDLIIFDGFIYIINHNSLERIFNMKKVFIEKASIVLGKVKESGKIENFEEFQKDVLNNGNSTKRLTKTLMDEGKIEKVLSNFNNIERVNEKFEKKFNIVNGKLVYNKETPGEMSSIILLLQDAYYQSHMIERQGIDDN